MRNGRSSMQRSWPRSARLLRRSDFQRVYARGSRHSSPLLTAFLLKTAGPVSRVGLTAPRALGKAVERNRIKRRVREAVRLHLANLGPGWDIVLNPRRTVLEADFESVQREVIGLFDVAARKARQP